MNDDINLQSGVVVNRQTQTAVPDSTYDDLPDGLPFYYTMDMRFCVILIIVGVIVGILQFLLMGGLLVLPFLRKEYRCIRCKTKYTKFSKPKICPLCGGTVVPEKEYIENQLQYDNIYKKQY